MKSYTVHNSSAPDFTKTVQLSDGGFVNVPPFVEVIQGSGGGGGGKGGAGKPPVEAKDTFRSAAIARVLLAYSVGETEGLIGGAKSIYFDGTPLQADDDSFNFDGVRWEERYGLESQPRISGFDQTTIVRSIATEVSIDSGPIIRTVADETVNAVRVIITVPSLQNINTSSGDINGTSVTLNFAVRDNDIGTWTDRGDKVITGKSSGPFQIAYRVEGPNAPTSAWDIRVTRVTADSSTTSLQNRTVFDTLVEINESVQTYPGVAYVGIEVDTELFGNKIPVISLGVSGVKVKVPVNYTEIDGIPNYDGTWNGSFKFESTSNPAWHVYNLIINNKYGVEIPEAFLDKYQFYTIAQYCDAVDPSTGEFEGVDDGDGGVRRRFTVNTQVSQQQDALRSLQEFASSFRGLLYYGAGAVVPAQDSPKSVAAIITNENVAEGKFIYASTEAKDRLTIANVTYNDRNNFFVPTITTYPPVSEWGTNPEILRYGKNIYDGAKFGCDNEAEAFAFAKWLVYSSTKETETCQFTVGPEHSVLRPGEVVEVYDRRFARERFGGRIVGGTTTTVILDAPVTLSDGETYQISIVAADGKTVETRNITALSGTVSTVTVSSAFSDVPTKHYTWAIKGSDIAPRLFRVINIEKKSLLEYEVFAMFHDANKYAVVEQDAVIQPTLFQRREFLQLKPPTDLTYELVSRNDPTRGVLNSIKVRWTPSTSAYVNRYRVKYRREDEEWIEWGITTFNEAEILDVTDGRYDFLIYSQNAVAAESIAQAGTYTVDYGGTEIIFGGLELTLEPPVINDVTEV